MTNTFLPAYLIPDTLYVNVGIGGAGGASTTSSTVRNIGTAGTATYVSFYPVQSSGYTICFANGGSVGSSAGTGGTAATVASSTTLPNSQFGLRTYLTAQGGSGGSTGGAASNLTAGYRITGGIGAWGAGNTGPNFFPAAEFSLVTYTPTDATQPGGGGFNDLVKFIFTTGLPARSSTVASAQNSGNSGYGCGGPGGAGGNPNSGAGGNGGDGLVIITCG